MEVGVKWHAHTVFYFSKILHHACYNAHGAHARAWVMHMRI